MPDTDAGNFLKTVVELAGHQDLDDPEVVGRLLRSQFSPMFSFQSVGGGCKDKKPGVTTEITTGYKQTGKFWFSTPDQDSIVGSKRQYYPNVNYAVTRMNVCFPSDRSIQKTASAHISFNNVNAYACITEDWLKYYLPSAKWHRATDFAVPYHYDAAGDPNKPGADFSYYFGEPCLLSVSIRQEGRTWEQKVAHAKWSACVGTVPDADWRDAEEKCGRDWEYLPGGPRYSL